MFNRGYVTVTPEHRFKVSRRLKDDYDNGLHYYAMHGRDILLPADAARRPDPDLLQWHDEHRFLA